MYPPDVTEAYLSSNNKLPLDVYLKMKLQYIKIFGVDNEHLLKLRISWYGLCCSGNFWEGTINVSIRLFWLTDKYVASLVLSLIALAHANRTKFGLADESGWIRIYFKDTIVYYLREFRVPKGSTTTYSTVPCFVKTSGGTIKCVLPSLMRHYIE